MKVVTFSRDFSFRRIGKFRWVFGAAAALAFTACGNSFTSVQPSELIVRIEGSITVAGTGDPIEGVLVEVRTLDAAVLEVSTDSQGFYTLSFLYRFFPGEEFCPFTIIYTVAGFQGALLSPSCSEEVQTIDLQLGRA
ncbi:MAG: carboxypeptidase regulatory-like domain-containing protein [Gemmatimonadetes bacterium]|nr:carboxypeptidase regulatory-like domain-containing protein [Gemmatimonadota bacterium]